MNDKQLLAAVQCIAIICSTVVTVAVVMTGHHLLSLFGIIATGITTIQVASRS